MPDKFTIENEYLKVGIKRLGAELCSVVGNSGVEFIWQAGKVWQRHAPNLFPIVGSLLDHEFEYKNKTYPLKHHGFARDTEFDILHQSEHSICLVLQESSLTLESYPFKFTFLVTYRLDRNKLIQAFRVINNDKISIPVSFGGHPAFNANPIDEFELVFSSEEEALSHKLAGPYIGDEKVSIISDQRIELSKSIFDEDALVFKSLNSKLVTLQKRNSNYAVEVDISNFPYLGIWAKPGAPFVCIEPWQGLADSVNHSKNIEEKEGVIMVENELERSFSMTFKEG